MIINHTSLPAEACHVNTSFLTAVANHITPDHIVCEIVEQTFFGHA